LAILGRSAKRVVEVMEEDDDVVDDGVAKAVAPAANVAKVRRAAESFMMLILLDRMSIQSSVW